MLRLFAMCQATKFAHLPVAGGWYDQHPALVDAFEMILQRQGQQQAEEQARHQREMDKKKGRGRAR